MLRSVVLKPSCSDCQKAKGGLWRCNPQTDRRKRLDTPTLLQFTLQGPRRDQVHHYHTPVLQAHGSTNLKSESRNADLPRRLPRNFETSSMSEAVVIDMPTDIHTTERLSTFELDQEHIIGEKSPRGITSLTVDIPNSNKTQRIDVGPRSPPRWRTPEFLFYYLVVAVVVPFMVWVPITLSSRMSELHEFIPVLLMSCSHSCQLSILPKPAVSGLVVWPRSCEFTIHIVGSFGSKDPQLSSLLIQRPRPG
jgi:hypothetical protein